jgi:beta-N-acetylhexosaminidase
VIISDDLEMGAVTQTYGKEDAPILALKAGCDLLCYRSENEALVALEAIEKALTDGKLDPNELRNSVERTRKLRAGTQLAKTNHSQQDRAMLIGCPDHLSQVQSFGF